MSHTTHGTKALHKQAAIDRKAAEHHHQVADAAYFLAEHRGFKGGNQVADWLAGEAEIDAAHNNVDITAAH
ncbi:MAG: DUF2934 domain-containing protein [Gallionella sp.]